MYSTVLKVCIKFTGEHPCWSVISIKFQKNFIEIILQHGCYPVNLLHIFQTPFPKSNSGELLLQVCLLCCRDVLGYCKVIFAKIRSNRLKVFCKIGASKFTGRHQASEKETLTQVFSMNFAKLLRKFFLQNTSRRLLLPR